MKEMMKIGLLVVACSLAMACGNAQVEQWLARAEACMETNSDSARRCLQYIEGTGACSDEQRARYALLRTQAMHKCRIPLESDSLINVAVAYYTDSDDCHRLALSLLYKGLMHKQNHQVEQAVEAFVASEQAFEGVEDYQYKALLYNHYASLLMKQNMYSMSLAYFKKSYESYLMGDSVHYVLSACSQIARIFSIMEEYDSAKVYYEHGLSYVENCRNKKRRNLFLHNYAAFLIERGEYDEAEYILKDCENKFETNDVANVYSALMTLYYKKKELDKALYYGRQILASDDSLAVCGGYLRLYNVYKGMGQMDSALHYHNLYRQYHSDIVMRQQTAKVAAIPNRVKSLQLEAENQALTGWRLWLTVALVGVSMVAMAMAMAVGDSCWL